MLLLAQLYEDSKDYRRARQQLTLLIGKNGEQPAYLARMVRVLLHQGETVEAQRQLGFLQQKDPDGLASAEMTARLKKARGQADEAAAVLTRFAKREGAPLPV